MQTFSGLAILSVLWIVLGFTLAFGPTYGSIIGSLDFAFLNNVPIDGPLPYAPKVPGIGFVAFNMMVAVITPLLITGILKNMLRFWQASLRRSL